MAGWSRHEGLAVGLPLAGIDTDQLLPARFMATPRSAGYGRFLLHDLRHDADGAPRPDFPLNDPAATGASILIARRNFGGGSSREGAVYALIDAGFRAVIGPSFGDIFAANAVNNGLLPARVDEATAERLIAAAPLALRVDLAARRLEAMGLSIGFELDDQSREKLINGWDDIDLTLKHGEAIERHAAARRDAAPWLWPAVATETGH
ncbi:MULTISPECIES: 3-isopropylmalate dehydratase small subunit [unclassified Roseitalea]|uniref:3-isopropylmalate dehydratase small subunit n=1 Tax=unclassified Roseitalea TaxID=2639107 RepID=UPI00273F6277|nr:MULTISPECIES: 3-isopropylmalate dehydratase small subunit [unclassified Roseitalea]